MSNKIVVAKTGFNALTETEPNNLAFSSDYNTLKYFMSGYLTVSVTLTSTRNYNNPKDAYASVSHNLNYFPLFIAYNTGSVLGGTIGWICPYSRGSIVSGYYINAHVDKTKFYIKISAFETKESALPETFSATVHYNIFKNNLDFAE